MGMNENLQFFFVMTSITRFAINRSTFINHFKILFNECYNIKSIVVKLISVALHFFFKLIFVSKKLLVTAKPWGLVNNI